jgi:phosphoribosylanthranilate isomerase
MTKIKLCGMTRDEDILVCNRLKPDYVGFVFWSKSKRLVTKEKAKHLKDMLDKDIKSVGVFVDEDINYVKELFNEGIIDVIQLHGNEDEDYITGLKNSLNNPLIIKSFKADTEEKINLSLKSSADYIIYDPGKGDGMMFNWDKIKNVSRDYFLAGGLDSGNVGEAIKLLHPYCVDVSSGIESDGLKDAEKMTAFVESARKANI